MEREVSEVDRKLLLKKNYLDKIRYYLTRNPISQDELYFMVRRFFSEYLKLDYEFTYEELSQELNKVFIKPKVKEHIDMFLIKLSESEYLEESVLGTAEINAYLRELDDIIRNMIFDDQPVVEENSSIIQKVLKRKSSDQDKVMDVSGASALIDEINYHITNGNVDTAKSSYVELSKIYDKLSKDDKKKIHDDMNSVYERLQNLIKNPKPVVQQAFSSITILTPANDGQNNDSVVDPIKSITNLIEEAQFYLNASNVDSAKKSYSAALRAYESLNPEDKKIMHPKVNALYNRLQITPRSTSNIINQNLSPKESSNRDETNLSFDLPALEPINITSNIASNIASNPKFNIDNKTNNNLDNNPVSNSAVSQSKISTASFVEDFGKSIASSSNPAVNNIMMEVKSDSGSTDSNTKFDFSAPIGNTDIEAESVTFQASGPVTEEIELDKLAPASDAPNMLFTVGVPEISEITTKRDEKQTKPVSVGVADKVKVVKSPDVKSSVSSISSTTSLATPVVTSDNTILNVDSAKGVKNEPEKYATVNVVKEVEESAVKNTVMVPDNLVIPDVIPEIQTPSYTSYNVTSTFTPNSPLVKLDMLLKKISDDIILEKLDKGKETYKDALMIYRSLRDSDKALCYNNFFNTFKKLDDALHRKSLHSILDEQLLDSSNSASNRPVVSTTSSKPVAQEKYVPESTIIVNSTTLPIILGNDPETTRVYELIEESYFNIDNHNSDLAMLKYFKAVEFYRKLSVADKRKAYPDLYRLFQKLAIAKKVKHY